MPGSDYFRFLYREFAKGGQRMLRRNKESGQALVLGVATLGILLIGIAGMGIDMGYLRYQKRLLQAAADSAAIAAASDLPTAFGGVTARWPKMPPQRTATPRRLIWPHAPLRHRPRPIGSISLTVNNRLHVRGHTRAG